MGIFNRGLRQSGSSLSHPNNESNRPDSEVTITLWRPAASRLPYLPGLDGLRALAVIAVLLYHAELSWIPGGFLGVEVFLVISGYLITALLLGEWQERGNLDLKAFWLRRARRLLPALYLLLVAVLVFAVIALPGEVAGMRGDALSAFGYVTNWYLIFEQKSYFEAAGRPSLLRHLWSLAVEEQFYLLWPLLFVGGMRLLKRRGMLIVTLVGVLASTLLMALLYVPDTDPSRVYYGTDTRAAGLLLGAALAFAWPVSREISWQGRRTKITSLALNLGGLLGLATLLWLFATLSEFQPLLYRGGFLLVALATALVIAAVVHPLSHLGPGFLGWGPLRWVGLRSYSLYLWHWPVYAVTRPQLDVRLDGLPLLALRLALSCLLAEFSYRYIETPFREGAVGRAWQGWQRARGWQRGQLAGISGVVLASLLVLSLAVATAQPRADLATLEGAQAALETPAATLEAVPTLTPEPTATPVPEPTITATVGPPTVTPKPPPKPGIIPGRITAIGDSVMLGAASELKKTIGEKIIVNARVSRYLWDGTDVVKELRKAGELGNVVVIHLGSNWNFTEVHFNVLMKELKDVDRVVFINLKLPRRWEASNNQVLAEGVKRYPNTVLLDWYGATANRPELFKDDGIHLLPEGAKLYASLVASYINGV